MTANAFRKRCPDERAEGKSEDKKGYTSCDEFGRSVEAVYEFAKGAYHSSVFVVAHHKQEDNIPLKALEAKAVAKHVMATVMVTVHLNPLDQLSGLPASSGIQMTRYGSSVVPDPS